MGRGLTFGKYMQMQIMKSKLIPAHEIARMRRVSPAQTAADPVAAWRELNAAHAAVHAALEHALRREHDLSTVEYEVLDQLSGCPKGKFRMQELAEAVHATQSTVSRVVARLEEEGLTTRAMCADDRRGIFAIATDAGRERLAAATPTYRRVIADTLG
jgi:DNA-binding MarR family transcriptional regulator